MPNPNEIDNTQLRIVTEPIETDSLLRFLNTTQAGAVVLFLGTVREFTQGQQTLRLCYEAHTELADAEMRRIAAWAFESWPLIRLAMVHRVGTLELGETSVAIGVGSAHRKDAFEAAAAIMDRIKRTLPVWKQEHWADGTTEWVHPSEDATSRDASIENE